MGETGRLRLDEVEQKVCDIASEQLGIPRPEISPSDRIIEDLNCDSLDLVELIMEVEEAFGITIPETPTNPVHKALFTRQPFRLADLAELAYLQQGTGSADRRSWRQAREPAVPVASLPFTQLGGRWETTATGEQGLFEPLETSGRVPQYRRKSDGMRCMLIPSASVEIGSGAPEAQSDEKPRHVAQIDHFLIDAEPVSTTAYCRFLNSIGKVDLELLADWFVLDSDDDRIQHMLIGQEGTDWRPLPGTERWPMILVSWFGANAYSFWANRRDWTQYSGGAGTDPDSFLPSEAQWEYAARGSHYCSFPWGDEPPSHERMRYGQHRKGLTYRAETLPMADVNEELGMSPFGLHHMAGNVWQWCRDWYDQAFYEKAEAVRPNPLNRTTGSVRSERGGSWIGPADLCRCSYRRGRPPLARGRCLGFRCVSLVTDAVTPAAKARRRRRMA
jgi:acyl carrier protein